MSRLTLLKIYSSLILKKYKNEIITEKQERIIQKTLKRLYMEY